MACGLAGLLCACGEKKKESESESVESPEAEPPAEVEEFLLLAEDRYRYGNGRLENSRPPKGFTGRWEKGGGGTESVSKGVVRVNHAARVTCLFDTSLEGPFAEFLDNNQMIGKDGTTIYVSFFQALTDVTVEKVGFVDFLQGDGDPVHTTQFCAGFDTLPQPAGPFGLRAKRDVNQVIAAPEELNIYEQLITLKIRFGENDQDRIYYYYNPSPGDEKSPDGALDVDDLSFDRYGLACWGGGVMEVRHFRIADNFEAVTIQ